MQELPQHARIGIRHPAILQLHVFQFERWRALRPQKPIRPPVDAVVDELSHPRDDIELLHPPEVRAVWKDRALIEARTLRDGGAAAYHSV